MRKRIQPQNEMAAQLLINLALCGGSRHVCVLGRLWGRGFDSTLAEDQDGTGVGANWRVATVPGVLLGSLAMLTVALLAWLPPSTLTVG